MSLEYLTEQLCHCIAVRENFQKNNDDSIIFFFFSDFLVCFSAGQYWVNRMQSYLISEVFEYSSKMLVYITFVKNIRVFSDREWEKNVTWLTLGQIRL